MNIVVCISSVPDTTSKINFVDNGTKLNTNGIQFVINPNDEFGLTRAMKLKECSGGKVTIITVGDSSVEPVMRKALAIGADTAVRINMVPKDSYSTAVEIANYLKKESVDLIITGRESIDYNGGAVGGMIAELLELPYINACNGLEISEKTAKMTREVNGGKENISTEIPCVISGQKGLVEESELRIPNMRGIMQSRTKPLQVLNPSSNETFTESINFEKPDKKSDCKFISSENIEELVSLLRDEAKVI